DLPASGGAFEPVSVTAPEGCLVNARPPAAVVAGNTETSSRIVDTLFLALGDPLRVERWELRRGSGGAGAHRGGDGVVRELRVLEDCRLSVLAERRAHSPRGAHGGGDGAAGRTLVNGEGQSAKVTRALRAGDVVRIETPGGGGYGD